MSCLIGWTCNLFVVRTVLHIISSKIHNFYSLTPAVKQGLRVTRVLDKHVDYVKKALARKASSWHYQINAVCLFIYCSSPVIS